MENVAQPLPIYSKHPQVVLVVGVNGSGKTTTIGKLASQFKEAGKNVVIAAGDTFRAAAVEQLQIWGDRANVPVLVAPEGSDPASLAFDALHELRHGENKDLGNMIFHLGNISEDILPDGRKQFENGLPGSEGTSIKTTNWGRTPSSQSLLYPFNSIENDRILQDVGLDGLSDEEEKIFFPNGPNEDPAGDNYQFFLQAQGSIIDRYKNYNGTDGNSPLSFTDQNRGSTTEPDTEDINRDQTMNTIDSYFEYRVPIRKDMNVGNHPFVTDVRENINVTLPNGRSITTRWIQFKVPIDKSYYLETNFKGYYQNINGIEDLRSIRFMRMILKDFKAPVIFRFGTLDLVRGDWRRYNKPLNDKILDNGSTTVDMPKPGSFVQSDFEFYLPKRASLFLTAQGQFKIVEGVFLKTTENTCRKMF